MIFPVLFFIYFLCSTNHIATFYYCYLAASTAFTILSSFNIIS